jgi:hypothetical protein
VTAGIYLVGNLLVALGHRIGTKRRNRAVDLGHRVGSKRRNRAVDLGPVK